MPVAAIIALISGVIAGVPSDIAAFNALKDLFDKNPNATVTGPELETLRQTAKAEHDKTQSA